MQAFPFMRQTGEHEVSFCVQEQPLHEVLRYLSDQKISLSRLERVEPTLESLFLEVVEK